MRRKTLICLAAVFLMQNLSGCITSQVYQEAVAKHHKPDTFVLRTACKSNSEILLKVTGVAAGEKGTFDIFIKKTNLIGNSAQQPIEVPRLIQATNTNQCPVGLTVLPIDRTLKGAAVGNEYVSKADEDNLFVYLADGRKVAFIISEETHRPDLYKVMFTPLTLMADVVVTPIMFFYLVINVGHIDG